MLEPPRPRGPRPPEGRDMASWRVDKHRCHLGLRRLSTMHQLALMLKMLLIPAAWLASQNADALGYKTKSPGTADSVSQGC